MIKKLFLLSLVAFLIVCGKRPDTVDEALVDQSQQSSQLDDLTQLGKEKYVQNGCHTCHGMEGYGDGPAGKVLKPPPRNYRDLNSYRQGHTSDEIVNTLLTGVPGTTMAPYPHISEKDRLAIAAYVIYLQKN